MPLSGCRQRSSASKPEIAVGAQIHQRLVVQLELAVGEGAPQIELHVAAPLRLAVHLALEEVVHAAAVGLGPIQRHVGVAHQLFRRRAVAGRQRDADAGADHDLDGRRCRRARSAMSISGPRKALASFGETSAVSRSRRTRRRRAGPRDCRRGPRRCSRSATCFSRRRPPDGRSMSLTFLNRSRSMQSTPTAVRGRAVSSACLRRSLEKYAVRQIGERRHDAPYGRSAPRPCGVR